MPKGQRIKYEDNHNIINGVLFKKCNRHHIYFPEENPWIECNSNNFYVNSKNLNDGLHPYCIRCNIKHSRIYQIGHKEQSYAGHKKYRQTEKYDKWGKKHFEQQRDSGYTAQWRRNNPERCNFLSSLHRKHDVSKTEEQAMLKIFDYCCAYCGMTLKNHKIKYGEKLHNEHVDDEGYNDLRNDVPACKGCNCSKHTDIMEEWYEKQSFYSKEKYDKIIWWITIGYQDYIEDKPPYRITKSRIKEEGNKYHYEFELWSVDEKRNMMELLDVKSKKKYLNIDLV